MKLLKRISSFILALLCQTLTAGAQTGYCVPAGSCSNSAQITLVAFGTINNPSGCGVNAYANYTGLTAPQILAGTPLPIRLNLAYYYLDASDVAIWIDYDRNGSFDVTEYIHVSSGIFGGTINTTINIRATAVGGLTRMRIRRWGAGTFTATDACLSYTTGETEDYNLYIQKIAVTHQAFADTLYNPLIPLTATIIQTDNGIVNTDSLKPRLWARKYGTSNWIQIKGSLRSGTMTNGQWNFVLPSDSLSLRKNGCDSVQYYFVAQDINLPSYIGYLPLGANHSNVQVQITAPPTLLAFVPAPH